MKKQFDLSIVIVNFNTRDFLKRCLESLEKNLDKSNLKVEVFVIDNGSNDGSVEMINGLIKVNPFIKDCPLRLIANNENLGFAKANNQALIQAQGKYLLLLNPDTIVYPKTISFMLNFMEKNGDVGIATCRVELPDARLDDACHRGFPTPWNAFCYFTGLGKIFSKSLLFNGYHLGYQNLDKIHKIDACCGAFMLMRRKVGESLGFLDEDYFWYGEDLDFCYRAKKKNWKVMFVPNVKILHYKGVASGIKKDSYKKSTADEKIRKIAQKSRFEVMRIFYEKHYKNQYPKIITWLVLLGIRVLSYMNRN